MLSSDIMNNRGGTQIIPDYTIGHSVRFNSADTAYLNRTFGTPTDNKKWTLSLWIKRSKLGTDQHVFSSYTDGSNYWDCKFNSSDQLYFQNRSGGSNLLVANTTAVFRDPSAWLHFVFVFDSANSTAAYRNRLYINNVEYTLSSNSSLNDASAINVNARAHYLGVSGSSGLWAYLDGYLADVCFVDGQALTPTSFAKISTTNSNWVPIQYAGTYGTNGFYLQFASGGSAAALGTDTSGNGSTWTVNNISVTAGNGNDWLTDTPSTWYGTLNPLWTNATITNGALLAYGGGGNALVIGNIAPNISDDWYWEVSIDTVGGTTPAVGISLPDNPTSTYLGGNTLGYGLWTDGKFYFNTSILATYTTFTTGDVLAVRLATGALYIGKISGGTITWMNSGNALITGLTGDWFPAACVNSGAYATFNFGQRAFAASSVPGVSKTISQTTLAEPLTRTPYIYNNTALYTGTGAGQSLINLHLKPDLVWLKSRSTGSTNHRLYDSVRGVQNSLISNSTAAEAAVTDGLLAFNDDGFSLGVGSGGDHNTTSQTYAAWCWTKGSTPGFDIVTYTGTGANRTVAHSLGATPEFMIVKNRGSVYDWAIYHKDQATTPQNNVLKFTTAASAADSTAWNNTAPTTSVFTVGTGAFVNENLKSMIAYLFTSKEGYCKIGKYTGNGSTDGPFVYCGFKPRLIMMKRADSGGENWSIWDTSRLGYNPYQAYLSQNQQTAEDAAVSGANSNGGPDILDNGFKCRSYNGSHNNSGTYVYIAFAESPFKYPRTQFSSSQTGLNLKGLRFNSADSSYLNRTMVTPTNNKIWTWSGWVKRSAVSSNSYLFGASSDSGLGFADNISAAQFWVYDYSGSYRYQLVTNQVFRDTSAWAHIVVSVDTTLATAADRIKLYVNGTQVTSFNTATYPTQNFDGYINSAVSHKLGQRGDVGAGQYHNGYLADVYFVDGQQLTPTSFAETNSSTNQWVPKIFTGTYGINGFHLTFSDSSTVAALGTDTSGNSNTWTVNNMSVTNDRTQDCLSDSPTANYSTWGGIGPYGYSPGPMTAVNGALDAVSNGTYVRAICSTMATPASGKWYWEVLLTTISAIGNSEIGIISASFTGTTAEANVSNLGFSYRQNGQKGTGGAWSAYGNSFTTGDIIGVALDLDNGAVYFAKNNTWQNSGDPTSGASKTGAAFTSGIAGIAFFQATGGTDLTHSLNAGQRAFLYTPPTGYKALCSTNLPSPAILKPNQYFDVSIYTGTGA